MIRSSILVCSLLILCQSCGDRSSAPATNNDLAKLDHQMESNPVEVITLAPTTFYRQLLSNGRLNAKRKSQLTFKTPGIISQVNVSNGDYVEVGTLLGTLDLTEAQHNINTCRENFEKAKLDLSNTLIGLGYYTSDTTAIPQETLHMAKTRSGYTLSLLSLENATRVLNESKLISPFSGKIADLKGKPHESTQDFFCTLIDDSQFDVDFNILETELSMVKIGQPVRISPFFEPDKEIVGKITNINPSVNDRGQIAVKAEIANDGSLLDGMNVKIMVENAVPDQLVVPKSAVVIRDNLQVLFRYSHGEALWTYVHTVLDNSDSYTVIPNTSRGAELSVGDTVIVSGNLNLANGSHVTIVSQ